MTFLISNSTIIEFLSIFDVSNLDIACTNNRIREYILSLFMNAVIYIDYSKRHLFYDKYFLEYIKSRKLYITNWYVFNNLNYFLDSSRLLYHYVNTLNIIDYNISISSLLFILNNFNKLSMLTLGNASYLNIEDQINEYPPADNEIFYDMYPSHKLNIINDTSEFKIRNYLSLENIYILADGISYDIYLHLLNMSPKLKKISIRTTNENLSKLIFTAVEKPHIKFIEIYDKNTSIKTALNIFSKLKSPCIGLRINVQGFNNVPNNQTIISIFTKNISIRIIIPFIIKIKHTKKIFNLCPNLAELSIEEDIDGNFGSFNYLLSNELVFPPLLDTIYIDSFNYDIIIKIIEIIKNIKYIYIEFIFDFEMDELNRLKKKYNNVHFQIMG